MLLKESSSQLRITHGSVTGTSSMSALALKLKKELSHAQQLLRVPPSVLVRQYGPPLSPLLLVPAVFGAGVMTAFPASLSATGIHLNVRYAPTAHLYHTSALELTALSPFGDEGEFTIRVGQKLLDDFDIAAVHPQPVAIHVGANETSYVFSHVKRGQVTFTLVAQSIGKTAATLQYGVDPPIAFVLNTLP